MSKFKVFNPDLEFNYNLPKMPSGEFVGEVYCLTHDVLKDLALVDNSYSNEQFIAVEKTLREYIWKATQRANLKILPPIEPLQRFFVIEGVEDDELVAIKIINETLDELKIKKSYTAASRVLEYCGNKFDEDTIMEEQL